MGVSLRFQQCGVKAELLVERRPGHVTEACPHLWDLFFGAGAKRRRERGGVGGGEGRVNDYHNDYDTHALLV